MMVSEPVPRASARRIGESNHSRYRECVRRKNGEGADPARARAQEMRVEPLPDSRMRQEEKRRGSRSCPHQRAGNASRAVHPAEARATRSGTRGFTPLPSFSSPSFDSPSFPSPSFRSPSFRSGSPSLHLSISLRQGARPRRATRRTRPAAHAARWPWRASPVPCSRARRPPPHPR